MRRCSFSISDVLKIAFEFTENEVNVISNNNFKRKNEINNFFGSEIAEQKEYEDY